MNTNTTKRNDVFHSYLVKDATYEGEAEIPVIRPSYKIPHRIISFSKAMRTKDFNQWVHFYEHDCKFACVWDNPRRYLCRLRKFQGVITPDFSLYRDMPLVMQEWSSKQSYDMYRFLWLLERFQE